jgi:hypothetical protein
VPVKRPVRSGLVIECQVACESLWRGAACLVGIEVHLLVFDALPEPLDKHMVAPTAFPVHADRDAVVFQESGELLAGELAPLIGVEDVWGPYRVIASWTASRQKSVVSVLESLHASTRRRAQSRTANKYTKPRFIGRYVISAAQT